MPNTSKVGEKKTESIHVLVTPRLKKKFIKLAERNQRTISKMMELVIEDKLQQEGIK